MKLCGKCRQPIEGDEEYICCGDAPLRWRCVDCAKVSEGFAFPYGMCPHCNSKLELIGEREINADEALAAIRLAFEIELGGQAFYARAARDSTDETLQDLFGRFAEMEQEHMDLLSRRYHAQVPDVSNEFQVERAALHAGLDSRPDDPANLFQLAIAFEERAVAFFTDRSASAPEGSIERQLYRELAAEEREHVEILATELDRWRQGKAGLL